MEFSEDEANQEPETPPPQEASSGGVDDLIGNLATQEVEEVATSTEPAREEDVERVYAIQRIYALRQRRLEIAPSAAFNLNDSYQSHVGVGVSVNYWFTNVLAIGANMLWYDFGGASQESDVAFFTRRSTRLGIPLNEWQTGAQLNFTYVPLYGKFNGFNRFIFQWDAYILGGVGIMRTRPISVFDPTIREFPDWNTNLAFNAGLGVRIFLSRWLAAFFEFRNYMFLERFENSEISLAQRSDPDTWLQNGSTLFNNATMQVGFTFFFPPRFEYRLPK